MASMNAPGVVAITGTHALVTGANRGLGKAFVDELLKRGVAGVYAAARNPDTIDIDDDRVIPIRLDVTNTGRCACRGVTLCRRHGVDQQRRRDAAYAVVSGA